MIKFFNVRSGEIHEIADDLDPTSKDAQIAAYFNSSDQNPNGIVQDFGWRLAPDTLKRIREIQEDESILEKIAGVYQIPVDGVSIPKILHYISDMDSRSVRKAKEAKEDKYQRAYDEQVRALDEPETKPPKGSVPSKKLATPTEIEAQRKKDEAKLAKMLADDKKKADNKSNTDQ